MGIREKLENIFSAAAFAEAGEFDTAREIAGNGKGTTTGHDAVCEGDDCIAAPSGA